MATGVGDSGVGISALSRGSLMPAAEGLTADTRRADAPVAGTRHLNKSWPFAFPTANR